MRYLIIYQKKAYKTDYYNFKETYLPGMIIIDGGMISFDGQVWDFITEEEV